MVGGRGRIVWDEEKIKELLIGYKEKKLCMSIFGEKDEATEFLDVCMEHYAPQDGALLRWIFIDGHSVREYAEKNGVSRTYIMKESKRILEMTARFFNRKFFPTGDGR